VQEHATVLAAAQAGCTIDAVDIVQPTSVAAVSGTMVAITGRSGSGKTTLLSMLLGYVPPTVGTVTRDLQHGVAVMPRVPGFDEAASSAECIALARSIRGLDGAADIDAYASALGLEGLLHRPVSTLSGGERQRVALLRAIAVEASVIVADEPTSQLDHANANRVAVVLRDLADRGRAVLVAPHDDAIIGVADTVHTLGNGSLA
jgi:putative ABC transport system ATP-binding protein